jgi:glycosyltransferase involved in cell wall biosynthesis
VDDVRPYFADAAACVVPLRISQGVQNKILEAMASGLPVVATSNVLRGLDARSGEDLLSAEGPKDFADKAVMLLEDPRLRKTIGENARRYAEEYHNWEKNLSVLDEIVGAE